MSVQHVQKTWDEYHERIRNRRLAEAHFINLALQRNAITIDTDLVLDFGFFTQDEASAIGIRERLSENYKMSISKNGDYWRIKGTSRPYAVNLTAQQHLDWVVFMSSVALSYGCIFSSWSITDFKGENFWSNEDIETEFD